jgi:hypothetical protein
MLNNGLLGWGQTFSSLSLELNETLNSLARQNNGTPSSEVAMSLPNTLPNDMGGNTPVSPQVNLTLFISYVHEDVAIATALSNLIQNVFGSDVAVFLDKVAIQHGDNILTSIEANLERADILVVVSTDVKGPRHWAGYEIGFFQASHASRRGPIPVGHPLWGKVVVFCSPGSSPEPLVGLKHLTVGFDTNVLQKTQEDFSKDIRITTEDPLLQWLGDLLTATSGEKLNELRPKQDIYKANIARFLKAVFDEFKQRPKDEFKPQKQLKISFSLRRDHRNDVAEDAKVELLGNAHSVFGIFNQGASITLGWADFCNELANGQGSLSTFGTITLPRILLRAVRKDDSLDEISGNLIWSHHEQKLYRVILTTCTTYNNGTNQASLYLVQVLRRPDHGDTFTTLLGKALQATLRFRALFLEQNGLFNYVNVTVPQAGLSELASDILAELDFLNMDLMEADLGRPSAYNGILTAEEIVHMASVWQPLRSSLIEQCNKILATIDDAELDTAKIRLADILKEIRARVAPLNEAFLRAVASKLGEIADSREVALNEERDAVRDTIVERGPQDE